MTSASGPGDDTDAPRTPKACRECGAAVFTRWDVPSGGGLSIKLLPLPFLQGGKLECEACLECGHVEWFVALETLELMRPRAGE